MNYRSIAALLPLALLLPSVIAQTNTFPASGSVGIGTTSPSAKLEVVGDLFATGNTFRIEGRKVHVLSDVSGYTPNPAVESYRYEIARLCVNSHHWQSGGPIEIELRQTYFAPNCLLRFRVTAGYGDFGGTVTLLEKSGFALYANVVLGAPVASGTSSGGYPNQYIPVYVDAGMYTSWMVSITHGWNLVSGDPINAGEFRFFSSPARTTLNGYVASPSGTSNIIRQIVAGSIGLGTASPSARIDAQFSDPTPGSYILAGSGYYGALEVGIPGAVDGKAFFSLHRGGVVMHQLGIKGSDLVFASGGGASSINLQTESMRITSAGNVGIGTTAPTHKLSVKGAIRANEVIVDTGWSDYVFADDYRLAPLSEVERHIKAEKHLPGIPSASEVAKEGVSVGDMQAKLLEKIEELTLHQIEQEKKIAALQARLAQLEPKQTP